MIKNSITVSQLIDKIYYSLYDSYVDSDHFSEYFKMNIDFKFGNKHLMNPLNLDSSVCYSKERKIPLTGNELVYGNYLIYCCVEQIESEIVYVFEDMDSVKEFIKTEFGLNEPFNYQLIVIENVEFNDFSYEQEVTCM